jgi:hypothetical protein
MLTLRSRVPEVLMLLERLDDVSVEVGRIVPHGFTG